MNNIKTTATDILAKGVAVFSNGIFALLARILQLVAGKRDAEVMLTMGQGKKNVIALLLVSVILLAILSIPLTTSERVSSPKLSLGLDPSVAVSEGMADEVSKLMNAKGKILILVLEQPGLDSNATAPGLNFFLKALTKNGGITVVETQKIPFDIKSPLGLPGESYLRILDEHPDVDAIFSYAGLPRLTAEQISSLEGKKIPKFAARINTPNKEMQIKELFEAQIIHLVTFPKARPPSGGKPPTHFREFFEQYFSVITSDNASSLSF